MSTTDNSTKSRLGTQEVVGGLVLWAIIGAGIWWYWTSSSPGPSQVEFAAAMPEQQRIFVNAVEASRRSFADAKNDLAKGAARPARATALCAALKSRAVDDWVGSVSTLSSNNDGRGVLAVRIGPDIQVGTWNNAVSDFQHGTLIEPSSPVFRRAQALAAGTAVRFSGTFFQSDVDCVAEQSITLAGSLSEPEFVFRFSDIKPLN